MHDIILWLISKFLIHVTDFFLNRHDLAFILKLKIIAIICIKKYIYFFVVNTTTFCSFLRKYILNIYHLSAFI